MNYIKDISPDLKMYFEEIKDEVIWLHAKWINFRQVYAVSEEQINLLNRVASTFFYIVQEMFWTDIILTLSRLTDPKKSNKKENLTFDRLVYEIDTQKHPELSAGVINDLNILKDICIPFRDRRNRIVAHIDLATALKVHSEPIPGISRQMVEDVLKVIRQLMNRIEIYFTNSETGYQHFIQTGDGESLIWVLKDAIVHQENEEKQLGLPRMQKL